MPFTNLGLSAPILEAIKEKGYDKPSPIQEKAIPVVLSGKDLMAAAQTGTGKTAGFTLPILEKLSKGKQAGPNKVRALILTPTRELAAQVGESVADYGRNLSLRSTVVFGGVKINPQMMKLRQGVDILVATPGRLIDLHNQNAVSFDKIEILVLDEADRMLDMGFIHDIRRIKALLPSKRQNLMFSATFSDEIRKLAKAMINDPVEVSVTPRNQTAPSVDQWICPVDKKQKSHLLIRLAQENEWQQVLVFTRTKHGANKLCKQLNAADIKAAAIHGNKSQGARTKALSEFKQGKITMLVATDIAARGLDINQLPQVVNFDLPNVPEDYVHRIGRTGRAGLKGKAVSLVCADEIKQLKDIERLIQNLLKREIVDGFDPVHALPESSLQKPRVKKPKRQKPENAGKPRNANRRNNRSGNSSNNGNKENTGQASGGNSSNRKKPNRSGNSAYGNRNK